MSEQLDIDLEIMASKPEVGLVEKEMIPYLWPQILEILLEKGKKWLEIVDERDVYVQLCRGEVDLWCAMHGGRLDGFMICGWERHGRGSYYHVIFLAGEKLEKYLSIGLEKIERYASIMSATEVVLEGRKGFARLLRKHGYYQNTIRMRKSVRILWRN